MSWASPPPGVPGPLPGSAPSPATSIDGGAVFVERPYTDFQWASVRRAWWWHSAGMFFFLPFYPIAALTAWQATSRQPIWRRVTWATVLTLGAVLLIGLPAFVVFSRRWYWLYRTKTSPSAAGVGNRPPDASRGHLEWVAVGGAALADRLGSQPRPPTTEGLSVGEPWASLHREAGDAAQRIRTARARATGPAVAAIAHAESEATAAHLAAHRAASRAAEIEHARQSMDAERIEARLSELDRRGGDDDDWEVARRSLREQLATVERMAASVDKLEGQLHRICAQLGEAAARAEELALCPPGSTAAPTDFTTAVDRLAAIRHGLEQAQAELPGTSTG